MRQGRQLCRRDRRRVFPCRPLRSPLRRRSSSRKSGFGIRAWLLLDCNIAGAFRFPIVLRDARSCRPSTIDSRKRRGFATGAGDSLNRGANDADFLLVGSGGVHTRRNQRSTGLGRFLGDARKGITRNREFPRDQPHALTGGCALAHALGPPSPILHTAGPPPACGRRRLGDPEAARLTSGLRGT